MPARQYSCPERYHPNMAVFFSLVDISGPQTYLFMICLPMGVEPVNPSFLTSGWSAILWPATEPDRQIWEANQWKNSNQSKQKDCETWLH